MTTAGSTRYVPSAAPVRPPGAAHGGAGWWRGPDACSCAPRPSLVLGLLALRWRARGLGPVQAASDARARLPAPRRSAPRAGLGAELAMRGWPPGRSLASPRPAPPSPGRPASLPSRSHAGTATRQAVACPWVLSGCILRLGQRRATRRPQPARFTWDGHPGRKTPPGYAAATACLDATVHRRQNTGAPRPGRRQRPCHRALCVLTR